MPLNRDEMRDKINDNTKTMEAKILEDQNIFHAVKNIQSMEELNKLIETTELRIRYMQARIEQNEWFLSDVVPVEEDEIDPAKVFSAGKVVDVMKGTSRPEPDITLGKLPDAPFIIRKDDGSISIAATVNKMVGLMNIGDQVKPHAIGVEMRKEGIITDKQLPTIRSTFAESTMLKRVERGTYERI
jgi:hypothetical protein